MNYKNKLLALLLLINCLFCNLILPEDQKLIFATHIKFSWEQIPLASKYNLKASNNSNFDSLLVDIVDSTLTYIDKNNFTWDQTVYWKVIALDSLENIIHETEPRVFYIGEQKFPLSSADVLNENNHQGHLTVFGVWWNWNSGIINENGDEIWNDGNLNVMVSHVDEHGQMYGAQDFPNDNAWIRGIEFDSYHNIIWAEPNGTALDPHDLRRLPNGNIVGMRRVDQLGPIPIGGWTDYLQSLGYEADGETNEVYWFGQELVIYDMANNQELWTWNPFDHYTTSDVDLHGGTWWWLQGWGYDWLHTNSIYFDQTQSAFYVSNRHISRISKIKYPSGEIDWMMGLPTPYMESGDVHLCNDLLFSFQHEAETLPNGNILFYDNGNLSETLIGLDSLTRIFEISINEENNDCEVVWEYVLPKQYYAIGMGSVQVLENGNYQITSGNQCGSIIEVTPNHEIVWKANLGLWDCHNALYRGFRIKTLYPQTYSFIAKNYEYIDQDMPGINIEDNENIRFNLFNESPNNLIFLFNAESQEDLFYENQFEVGAEQTILVEIPSASLNDGINSITINIKTQPFYKEQKTFTYNIYKTEPLSIKKEQDKTSFKPINVPNPFNSTTKIKFIVDNDQSIALSIYNLNGKIIKKDYLDLLKRGLNEYTWNAKDNYGKAIPGGIYFYQLKSFKKQIFGKMIYLK